MMVMNLDDVDEEPDDKEGDGAQDVEERELLPGPHLSSKTKFTWQHSFALTTPLGLFKEKFTCSVL